ncbi:MAG: ATP-binding protein [Lachnospiraceae bacterium]|nr:ATP-binding protein [Lachnospiraceae bacterium]
MAIITVSSGGNISVIQYNPDNNTTLADILYNNGFPLNTVCGGTGFCKKCLVIVDNIPQKACSYIPCKDITVSIPKSSLLQANIPGTHVTNTTVSKQYIGTNTETASVSDKTANVFDSISVAIDIGSTSVSTSLVGMGRKKDDFAVIDTSTIFNPTVRYGSDVIARVQASAGGRKDAMSSILIDTLESEVKRLITSNHLEAIPVNSIYISCNTIMQHLLLGLDCTGILAYPFTPVPFDHNFVYKEISVFIIPSFSTFVGGDIVSGLYYLDKPQYRRYILLDLGTNAEMVLVDGDRTFCTSAAAGPAFEGAGISCGCAYIKGAVRNVTIKPKQNKTTFSISYKTIDNKLPVGICGSGIMDIYSQFVTNHIIDENKTFVDKYMESGFEITKSAAGPIVITQQDIRHIQLAVSAIKTGIDILLRRSGLSASDIEKVYIAGSFGSSLQPEAIKNTNLLPKEFINRQIIQFSGNTSLSGAIKCAVDRCCTDSFNEIMGAYTEIELANDSEFNSLFIGNL